MKRALLIFSLTRGFHHDSIPAGIEALRQLGETSGAFRVTATEDPAVFEPDRLKAFDAVVFLNTTGELFLPPDLERLPPAEQEAARRRDATLKASLLAFIRSGHGFIGIHAASDTFYQWPEYGEVVGGYFNGHPWHEPVGVHVEEPGHPLNAAFGGKDFELTDEIYQFRDPYSRERLHVLLTMDRTRTPRKGARADNDYALAWIRNEARGRVFYCALGHRDEVYANPVMRRFYLDGIRWALGDLKADAAPSARIGSGPTDLFMGEYEGVLAPGAGAPLPARAYAVPEGNGTYRIAVESGDRNLELHGELDGTRVAFAEPTDEGLVETWSAAGPYRKDGTGVEGLFDMTFPPESRDAAATWVPVAERGVVDLQKVFGKSQHCAGYLRATFASAKQQDARLELGSDDGIKVWLNGALVHANRAMRGLTPGEDVVNVKLAKGPNELLLKITQGTGDWAACAAVKPLGGGALTGVRGRDPSQAGWTGGIEAGAIKATAAGPAGTMDLHRVARHSPTEGAKPPAGAVVLLPFGTEAPSLAAWENDTWTPLADGSVRVGHGDLRTRRVFGDIRLHLEFMTPYMPEARGQGRGNSGVYFQDRYELQVLDSFGLPAADNECGAIYTIEAPRVNAAFPPLAWQTYDVVFRGPRLNPDGTVKAHARFDEVKWNGVTVHERLDVAKSTGGGADGTAAKALFRLQDHGNPVRYRNCWVVELRD